MRVGALYERRILASAYTNECTVRLPFRSPAIATLRFRRFFFFVFRSEQIAKCLSWMLMAAVAAVYYGNGRILGRKAGRAVLGVAHDNYVCVV